MPARFSASYADRYMACNAAANLDIALPGFIEPERDETAENAANLGTMIHEIMADAAALTPMQLEGLLQALTWYRALLAQRRWKKVIEEKVDVDWLPSAPKTTVDLVLYLQDEIHIVDWKTGKILVDAKDNKQMLYYAATHAWRAPGAKGVWVHIVQPWADGHIDSHYITVQELKDFIADAVAADLAITAGNITFHPTEKGCLFCPANPHSRGAKGNIFCPALMNLYYPMPIDTDALLLAEE